MKKKDFYKRLYAQLEQLLSKSPNALAQLSTINAILYHKIKLISWCGVYFYAEEALQVGPYQGLVACQELKYPNGVCWAAVINRSPVLVADVHQFDGHIACDSKTNSEIVFPIFNSAGAVWGVYDIDSYQKGAFDEEDQVGLQEIINLIQVSTTE